MAEHECANFKCKEPATRRCSACTHRSGWYCTERCQRKSWPLHIFDCKTTKPAKTAYHMAVANRLNRPPPHWQTKQDYGFSKLSPEDQMTLLDVYRILLGPMGVEPKTLDRWMTRKTLLQEIKAAFQAVPEACHKSSFLWFLENQWVLDPVQSAPAPHPLRELWLLGWRYYADDPTASPTNDQMGTMLRTWPEEMDTCFELCMSSLSKSNPRESMESWIHFGFCTCADAQEKKLLGTIYGQVIDNCKFDELLSAYRTSSLAALIDKYGLRNMREPLSYLEDVLSCTGSTSLKSVWRLKQFVFADVGNTMEPIPVVAIDYGFANCKEPQEINDLKGAYQKFFESRAGDPIRLHNAAMAGKVFKYVQGIVKLKKKFRHFMKNPHTLENLL